ncbi:hypothetical protein ABE10_13250 [Bacillus toyonensis]|nr:hypothetical protein [Bacillus toyonensis]
MLDLVVQPAHEPGGPPASAYVAGGAHLLGEEVEAGIGRDDRHALVVRSERGPHVHAEDGELDAHEGERHAKREHEKHRDEHGRESHGEHPQLLPAATNRVRGEKVSDAQGVEIDAL